MLVNCFGFWLICFLLAFKQHCIKGVRMLVDNSGGDCDQSIGHSWIKRFMENSHSALISFLHRALGFYEGMPLLLGAKALR